MFLKESYMNNGILEYRSKRKVYRTRQTDEGLKVAYFSPKNFNQKFDFFLIYFIGENLTFFHQTFRLQYFNLKHQFS